MSGYDIALYHYDDLEELLEIYQRSFNGGGSLEYFKWKYLTNPSGQAVSFVARHEGRIAAFYGLMPERYLIKGRDRIIYQSMDTMTHPDHRGKGLFNKLAHATCDHVKVTDRSLFAYGYPGPSSYGGFVKKLQWRLVTEMPYHFVHRWVYNACALTWSFSDLEVLPINEMNTSWDDYFSSREGDPGKIRIKLDRELINWRTMGHPTIAFHHLLLRSNNEIVGLCIYRRTASDRIFIQLLDFSTAADRLKHTAAVIRYLFRDTSTKFISTFHHGDPTVAQAYARCGFMANPFQRGPFSYRTPYIVLVDPQPVGWDPYDMNNYIIQPVTRDY